MIVGFYKPKQEENVIKIGAILPLTGPGAGAGNILRESLEWKIEELKKEGYNIDFIVEDTHSDPKSAVTAFNKLVDVEGVKIIFTITSSHGMVLKPLAEKNKVLLWADTAHPEQVKNSHYVLRHSNTVGSDANAIFEDIIKKNLKKIGIIYQLDEWGLAYNNYLSDKLKSRNIEVYSEGIDPKESDFRLLLLKMKEKGVNALVFVLFGPGAGLVVKQARESGYKADQLYSSIGFLTPDAQTIAGDYAKGMYYTHPPLLPEFEKDYREKFGKEPSILGYIGYTDIELLFYAINSINSTEPEPIINFIKNLGNFSGKYENVTIEKDGDIPLKLILERWE